MSWLRTLVSKRPDRPIASGFPSFTAPVAPDAPFYAIGDIHGSITALEALLIKIESVDSNPRVVCVGDYIDRGDDSANVLRWLKRLNEEFGDSFTCLMGNHEQMLLRFLENPSMYGDRWFRHGGLQTLASYNVSRPSNGSDEGVRDNLFDAMGEDMVVWLANLPLVWQSGNVAVVHAAADPILPLEAQSDQVLRWGHPDFFSVPRTDGIWVVHGHTIVDQAEAVDGRISVDTGAYATGSLTAAYVAPGGVSFLST